MKNYLLPLFIGCCFCAILWLNSLPVFAESDSRTIYIEPNEIVFDSEPHLLQVINMGISGDLSWPDKPYIYEDPNLPSNYAGRGQMICSKHGKMDMTFEPKNKIYCYQCYCEIIQMYLDKHITGMPTR